MGKKPPASLDARFAAAARERELQDLVDTVLLHFRIAARLAPRGTDLRRQLDEAYQGAVDVVNIERSGLDTMEGSAKTLSKMRGREGGRRSGEERQRVDEQAVIAAWQSSDKPEHNRAAVIAKALKLARRKVDRILIKHGIRAPKA